MAIGPEPAASPAAQLEPVAAAAPQRTIVLGFLFVLSIISSIDRICISVAGKTIQEEMHLSPSQWGWVLGAFVAAYAIFEIPTGSSGDRVGPRRVLTRIVIWWSIFTALSGAARNVWQLIITRFMLGAGEAGAYPNSTVAISRWFPRFERARAQAIVWMGSRIGSAIAPLVILPIQAAFGWRWSFALFGAVGIVWAVAWWFWFRDSPAEKAGKAAAAGDAPPVKEHVRLPWRQIFGSGNFWWVMLMYHAHCWSAFFFLTWLHTFLQNGRGYTRTDLLQLSWLPFVCGALATLLGGTCSDLLVKRIGLKWGRRWIGIVGHAVASVFLLLAFFTPDKFATIAFLAIAYAGSDFMLPVAWAVCLDIGGKKAGAVSGAMNTAGQIGSFLTTVLFGQLISAFGSYDVPLIPIIVMSTISALAWFKIDPTQPLEKEA